MPKRVIGRHKAFLKAFAATASITLAAKAAKIDRGNHYDWLRDKPGYREEFARAFEQAAQLLEDEAVRRAYKGVFKPNVYQGEFVYPKRKRTNPKTGEVEIIQGRKPLGLIEYSDSLLALLLKRFRPEAYRDRILSEITGAGPITITDERLTRLSDDELKQLLTLAQKLSDAGSVGSGEPAAPRK